MRFRQSFLKQFMSCPLQAKFAHVDNLPGLQNAKASFGSCIHHALEIYNKTADLDASIEAFTKTWHSPELLGVEPQVWPKYTTYGGLRQRGIEILREYHAKQKWETRTVVAIEHRFLVPFGKHELEGTVDLIELKKSSAGKETLRVVDYKTNAKAPTRIELGVNIQFTVYEFASHQPEFWLGNGPGFPPIPFVDPEQLDAVEELPRRCIWYQLMQNKELDAGKRGDLDYLRLYRACNEIEKSIESGVFVPDISGETCTFCPYVEPCGLPIPTMSGEDGEAF